MNKLLNILYGAGSLVDISGGTRLAMRRGRPPRLPQNGWSEDKRQFAGDLAAVGGDFAVGMAYAEELLQKAEGEER